MIGVGASFLLQVRDWLEGFTKDTAIFEVTEVDDQGQSLQVLTPVGKDKR